MLISTTRWTKSIRFRTFCPAKNISKKEVLYLGDDIPDLEIYPLSGISACPADGSFDNLNQADYICRLKGGMGCVRKSLKSDENPENGIFKNTSAYFISSGLKPFSDCFDDDHITIYGNY
ncbi:MAG: hypothetical protein IPL63_14520 [Saprospiraceae bacterium]|nr:hypothetical protein [Saprospiraceae bacterium]